MTGLYRRKWLVVGIALAALTASIAASLLSTKMYTASASLLFRDAGFDQRILGTSVLTPSNDAAREAATNVRLVSLDVVGDRTAKAIGVSRAEVMRQVEVRQEGVSNVVSVNATTDSPARSARLADTFARQYIRFRRSADRAKIAEALVLIRRRIASLPQDEVGSRDAAELRKQEQLLTTVGALQTGNAELVQPANVPTSPTSPRPLRSALLSLFAGVLLGLLVAVGVERFDKRVRSGDEVRDILGAQTLGLVPTDRSLASRTAFLDDPKALGVEAINSLRTNLRYVDVQRRLRLLVVTSAVPGEGKSTICWTLAAATAQAGSRVLLIEADLRSPSLSRLMGLPVTSSLNSVLVGEIRLCDAVHEVPVGLAGDAEVLHVLPAATLAVSPSDMLESEAMSQLLEEARESYDLVLLDTPPVTLVADAVSLIRRVDGIIVVSRLGVAARDGLMRMREIFDTLDVRILGVVINGAEPANRYGYGYGESEPGADARVGPPNRSRSAGRSQRMSLK